MKFEYQLIVKMKKIVFTLVMAFLSITILPVLSNGADPVKPDMTAPAPKAAEEAQADALILRLNEINSMDKSNLTSAEKKDLRKEVKLIEASLKQISGGVYISSAAILILIVVLLIILL
jgi:hypothetical protein